MNEDGIGLDEIVASLGTWWVHICSCGYRFDSLLQVDTCWMCGQASSSMMDQQSADVLKKRVVEEELPEKLREDVGVCRWEKRGRITRLYRRMSGMMKSLAPEPKSSMAR